MKDLTAIYGSLLIGMRELGQWGVDGGHLDVGNLRLTVAARQEQAKLLIDAGVSERDAAKALGISKTAIRNDLGKDGSGHKVTKNGHKGTKGSDDEEPDLPDQKTIRARYQRSLLGDALAAIAEMSKTTRAEFFTQLKEKYGYGISS